MRWIGPLFLANAAASVVTIIGLAYWRTRALAALAGVVISALALGSLVVSYGHGLFGWQEGGFRTAVAIAVTTEMCAAILLSAALTTRCRAKARGLAIKPFGLPCAVAVDRRPGDTNEEVERRY